MTEPSEERPSPPLITELEANASPAALAPNRDTQRVKHDEEPEGFSARRSELAPIWRITSVWRALAADHKIDAETSGFINSATDHFEHGRLSSAYQDLERARLRIGLLVDVPSREPSDYRDLLAASHVVAAQIWAVGGKPLEAKKEIEAAISLLIDYVASTVSSVLAIESLLLIKQLARELALKHDIGLLLDRVRSMSVAQVMAASEASLERLADFVPSRSGTEDLDVPAFLRRSRSQSSSGSGLLLASPSDAQARQKRYLDEPSRSEDLFAAEMALEQQQTLDATGLDPAEAQRIAVWLLRLLVKAQTAGHELAVVSADDEILLRVTL